MSEGPHIKVVLALGLCYTLDCSSRGQNHGSGSGSGSGMLVLVVMDVDTYVYVTVPGSNGCASDRFFFKCEAVVHDLR